MHYVLLNSFGLFIIALKREKYRARERVRDRQRQRELYSVFLSSSTTAKLYVCIPFFHTNFTLQCLHCEVTEGGRQYRDDVCCCSNCGVWIVWTSNYLNVYTLLLSLLILFI